MTVWLPLLVELSSASDTVFRLTVNLQEATVSNIAVVAMDSGRPPC